jgi:hypothetical protein
MMALSLRWRTGIIVGLGIGLGLIPVSQATRSLRPFTVADDIGFGEFQDLAGTRQPILYSPDGQYFVVQVERGRLEIDRPESTVRVYSVAEVGRWVRRRGPAPAPRWVFSEASFRNGPNISRLRWLGDSSALAFLALTERGNNELRLAQIASKAVTVLSLPGQSIKTFHVLDRNHFAYTVFPDAAASVSSNTAGEVTVGTSGQGLSELIFPESLYADAAGEKTLLELWAASEGHPFPVIDQRTGRAIRLQGQIPSAPVLALSPDGRSVVTTQGVEDVPREWVALYPPSYPASAYRVRSGHQGLSQERIYTHLVRRYVSIELASGTARALLDAPIADVAGWWHFEDASWSPDGQFVALSNAFMPRDVPAATHDDARPCIVVVHVGSGRAECLQRLKGPAQEGLEKDYRCIQKLQYLANGVLAASYEAWVTGMNGAGGRMLFERASSGGWMRSESPERTMKPAVFVKESLSQPPVLRAASSASSAARVLWDPNPQLDATDLSSVRVYEWRDASGRHWKGGLYTPSAASTGKRYPLVIQNHGFRPDRFIPSGLFTTVNAARALASAGIAVLQVEDCAAAGLLEAACQVAGYDAAVAALARDGLIDPEQVGIMGFSRTCYYVLAALTRGAVNFKAALIANGVNAGYLQSILYPSIERDAEGIIGAAPYGAGLKQWLERSPVFNLERVRAPLRIEASEGPATLLFLWEPYALLTYMKKPVDLSYHRDRGTHPLTNPAQRLASQGGAVDWFRFWLQGYERREPVPGSSETAASLAEQYTRWRKVGGAGPGRTASGP